MSSVNVDVLLTAILRPAVAPAGMFTLQPADLLSRMPCVVAKHIGGPGVVDPRFTSTRATVQVDAYAVGKHDAFDLAALARQTLLEAWLRHTPTPHGAISNFAVSSEPAELRLSDQADGFTRYNATYLIVAR